MFVALGFEILVKIIVVTILERIGMFHFFFVVYCLPFQIIVLGFEIESVNYIWNGDTTVVWKEMVVAVPWDTLLFNGTCYFWTNHAICQFFLFKNKI